MANGNEMRVSGSDSNALLILLQQTPNKSLPQIPYMHIREPNAARACFWDSWSNSSVTTTTL